MYAVEMGSVAMIHIPSFVKIGSSIQMLTGGFTDTDNGDRIRLFRIVDEKCISMAWSKTILAYFRNN
jgi:hypothetical protein